MTDRLPEESRRIFARLTAIAALGKAQIEANPIQHLNRAARSVPLGDGTWGVDLPGGEMLGHVKKYPSALTSGTHRENATECLRNDPPQGY